MVPNGRVGVLVDCDLLHRVEGGDVHRAKARVVRLRVSTGVGHGEIGSKFGEIKRLWRLRIG